MSDSESYSEQSGTNQEKQPKLLDSEPFHLFSYVWTGVCGGAPAWWLPADLTCLGLFGRNYSFLLPTADKIHTPHTLLQILNSQL